MFGHASYYKPKLFDMLLLRMRASCCISKNVQKSAVESISLEFRIRCTHTTMSVLRYKRMHCKIILAFIYTRPTLLQFNSLKTRRSTNLPVYSAEMSIDGFPGPNVGRKVCFYKKRHFFQHIWEYNQMKWSGRITRDVDHHTS